MISEVWHVRNIRQRYSYETVSGSKYKVNIAISFDRADGVPSQVVTVRSDGGGEFCGGKFGDLPIYVDRDALSKKSPRPTVSNLMG